MNKDDEIKALKAVNVKCLEMIEELQTALQESNSMCDKLFDSNKELMEAVGSESDIAHKVIDEYVKVSDEYKKVREKRKQTANKNLSKAFDKRDLKRPALIARTPDYDQYVKKYKIYLSWTQAQKKAREKVTELASKDIGAPISESLAYDVFKPKKKK